MTHQKSRSSQGRGAALVRVHMYTRAGGPDGMLEPGHTYDLHKDVAEPLIESGDARLAEEQPSAPELAAADPEYPGPWSEAVWRAGIPFCHFVAWWSPERCQEIKNWVSFGVSSMTSEEERRETLFWQAIRDLRHDLHRARKSGWTYGQLPKDIRKEPEPFSATMQYEFIENVSFHPTSWCVFKHDGKLIAVRVFPPGRFATEEAQTPALRKGRPGSPRKWDRAGARRYLFTRAQHPDGLPSRKAHIVKALADWFLEEHGDHPSETWLKDFVEEEVGHLLKDGN